jgi:ABC-type antimicrobial peptide transport system permease subunit
MMHREHRTEPVVSLMIAKTRKAIRPIHQPWSPNVSANLITAAQTVPEQSMIRILPRQHPVSGDMTKIVAAVAMKTTTTLTLATRVRTLTLVVLDPCPNLPA